MIDRFLTAVALALASLAFTEKAAEAHPHVWVTMRSEIIFDGDGSVIGVRHAWTFDDMFSTFATQDIKGQQKGVYTREELAPLAEINVTSLKEFDYFTKARANGKRVAFTDPKDYYLEYKDAVLTLHFTLPLAQPVRVETLDLEIYDPTYFVDFSFAQKDAVALSGASGRCKFTVQKPTDAEVTSEVKKLGEAFFAQADASNYGAMFLSRISVTCP